MNEMGGKRSQTFVHGTECNKSAPRAQKECREGATKSAERVRRKSADRAQNGTGCSAERAKKRGQAFELHGWKKRPFFCHAIECSKSAERVQKECRESAERALNEYRQSAERVQKEGMHCANKCLVF